MKKGNGGAPITPVKPQRPERDPTGRILIQKRPPAPLAKAPPPVPRTKNSITPPKRDSDGREIQQFFRAKPDSDPPSVRMSIEIDVDAEMERPQSEPTSILVDFDDPVSELPASPIETGKKLEGFVTIKRELSTVLKRIYPKADGKSLEFTEKKILLDSKEIGKVEKTVVGISLRIWMHNLGFEVDSLPASTIFGLFNIADFFYADAKAKANYVSLYAESIGKRNTIKICFHKEEKPAAFLTAPIRTRSSANR
jgi:hypothetical protein